MRLGMRTAAIVVGAVAGAVVALQAAAAEPRGARDVNYTGRVDARRSLDLYAPATGAKRPILFWIHGGGWQAGDKAQVDLKPQALVERGWLFVSTNYRLLPDATIDQMAGDVAQALRWVHDHAAEHGGDPQRIVVSGHSAGAQLAALVCTDPRYLEAAGLSLASVKGCIPVDGDTYDVPLQIATVEPRRAEIYRRKFGDETQQKRLSPALQAARDKGVPPFLILHVADHPEVTKQSQRLTEALKAVGVQVERHAAPGKTHLTINSDLGKADDEPTRAVWKFLDAR